MWSSTQVFWGCLVVLTSSSPSLLAAKGLLLNDAIFKPGLLSGSIQQIPAYLSGRTNTRFSEKCKLLVLTSKNNRLSLEVEMLIPWLPLLLYLVFIDMVPPLSTAYHIRNLLGKILLLAKIMIIEIHDHHKYKWKAKKCLK